MMTGKWINHALRRSPWRSQRQAVALVTLSFFVALVIGALYLSQSATVATTGRELEDLIIERNQLEQRNEELRAEIASLRSVPRLQQRARDMNFELAQREDIEYLVIEGYDPTRPQDAPVTLQLESEPAPVYDETFTGWLQQQLDAFTSQLNSGE